MGCTHSDETVTRTCCLNKNAGSYDSCDCPKEAGNPGASVCSDAWYGRCINENGIAGEVTSGEPGDCTVWARSNYARAKDALLQKCTADSIMKNGSICNEFCQSATGAYLAGCNTSVYEYCDGNMGQPGCQAIARQMKLSGSNIYDAAAKAYCTNASADPFCSCLASTLPMAHCLDAKCTNSVTAYPSSIAECKNLSVYDCNQAVSASQMAGSTVDKTNLTLYCGGTTESTSSDSATTTFVTSVTNFVTEASWWVWLIIAFVLVVIIGVSGWLIWGRGTNGSSPDTVGAPQPVAAPI